jgi:hypothetical protein
MEGIPRNQGESDIEDGVCLAALRLTAPLAAIVIVLLTVAAHVFFGEIGISEGIPVTEAYSVAAGASAVILSTFITVLIWLTIAVFCRRYTAANTANRRNYKFLCERHSRLKNRIEYMWRMRSEPRVEPTSAIDDIISDRALTLASDECEQIGRQLTGRGMPWVTGIGYIQLWHRVHRAEEALIKVEPYTEAIAGAMRDESRLQDSHIDDKNLLLKRLSGAVAMLDSSGTDAHLSYLAESEKCTLQEPERAKPDNRAKALTILSEVRYEINHFRDNCWEGIVHARNRLFATSASLGFACILLLDLAVFMNVPYSIIVWAVAYFLIGAITGLFARSQSEITANTAVDDFGLSTARLMHIPWLSGLAAVGGVLVSAVADSLVAANGINASTSTLAGIFDNRPTFLVVAAVFGLTPDLLIRRLTQQSAKYEEDLESTEASQSTKVRQPEVQAR